MSDRHTGQEDRSGLTDPRARKRRRRFPKVPDWVLIYVVIVGGAILFAAGPSIDSASNTKRLEDLVGQFFGQRQTSPPATASTATAASNVPDADFAVIQGGAKAPSIEEADKNPPEATAAPAAPDARDANIALIQKARTVVSEWEASKTPPLSDDEAQALLGELYLAEGDVNTPNVSANAKAVVDQLYRLENDRQEEQAKQDAKCASDLDCMAQQAIPIASVMCGPLIEKFAKYQFRWTQGFLQSGFTAANWVNRKKGIVAVGGDDIEFENGFGVWQPMSYACTVDVPNAAVIHVKVVPGRLP